MRLLVKPGRICHLEGIAHVIALQLGDCWRALLVREVVARILFRLAYRIAPRNYHDILFCQPGEHIGKAIVEDGGYERALVQVLKRFLRDSYPGRPVHLVDIGANIGTHTLGLSDICVDSISFEPNPLAAAALRLNIALNNLVHAEVRECALSASTTRMQLSIPADNQGQASLGIDGGAQGTVWDVTTSTLDQELSGRFSMPSAVVLVAERFLPYAAKALIPDRSGTKPVCCG